MIFNLFIFNRQGVCLFYEEWNRKRPTQNIEEEKKLMFGLLWSLKSFTQKISPKPVTAFNSYTTPLYKLHFFETASGLKFVLLTDPSAGDLKEELRAIYSGIFIPYVVRNPLYRPGEPVQCPIFSSTLKAHLSSLPCFKA
eukprot:GILI01026571.1.p1 GENE.GILI01026571.1~~GILI01026571.1.p1  ORF type:complete len:140 (+),score=52.14 GILI01026571.1:149-568(+)